MEKPNSMMTATDPSNVSTANRLAAELLTVLDALFSERESGKEVSGQALDSLESRIEKCAMHEALEDEVVVRGVREHRDNVTAAEGDH